MNNRAVFALLTLVSMVLIVIASYPRSAKAVEQLTFGKKISPSLEYQVNIFLEKTYKTHVSLYDVAEIDLNNDGVDEYVLKQKTCKDRKKQCTYNVIAEKDDEIILLAKVMGYNIMIGKTSSYGVKDILVFKNKTNDYNFDIYVWSPAQNMYIMDRK